MKKNFRWILLFALGFMGFMVGGCGSSGSSGSTGTTYSTPQEPIQEPAQPTNGTSIVVTADNGSGVSVEHTEVGVWVEANDGSQVTVYEAVKVEDVEDDEDDSEDNETIEEE